jgi:hypothetical protein
VIILADKALELTEDVCAVVALAVLLDVEVS